MVVLDSDHVSLLEKSTSIEGERIRRRLQALPPAEQATTIITYEEQTRGWLAFVKRARTPAQEVIAYAKLKRHIEVYRQLDVLAYDETNAQRFQELSALRLRIGTQDLRIAAICLTHNATLLTRNLRDFKKVPRLKVEDWSAA
jgi:tRNA(fMet)-specific endonuclease VapC